jgi:DNA-directed RNA polymerase specialized sigma24 family protein
MIYDSELVGVLAEAANRYQEAPRSESRDQLLRECLKNLPPRSQEVMRMRYGDSFAGVEQIAVYLGRSMAATYGILKRLRTALLQCIEERNAEEVVG